MLRSLPCIWTALSLDTHVTPRFLGLDSIVVSLKLCGCWQHWAFRAYWCLVTHFPVHIFVVYLVFEREETELDDLGWIFGGLKRCISGHKVTFCASIVAYICNPNTPDAEAGGLRVWSETWQFRKSYPKKKPKHPPKKKKKTLKISKQVNNPFNWPATCFCCPG